MEKEIKELEMEVDELEKRERPFFQRLKEEIAEERNKPLRLSPLNILYGAFAIGAFILVCILAFYVLNNVNLLQANPCKLCEDIGFTCVKSFGG